jgi:hypothetical protein
MTADHREMAMILQLEDLRQRADDAFQAALRQSAPALIEVARVVAEGGVWTCEGPIPRVGPRGRIEDWQDCRECLPCRLNVARERLAEVEL